VTSNATTISVAEEAGNATSADDNRACSNGRSEEDKCVNGKTSVARGSVSTKEPICHGSGQKQ